MNETRKPTDQGALVLDDALHAPVLFYDSVPAFGLIRGIVAVTLATGRWLEIDNKVEIRPVVVGHLRMTPESAAILRDALDKALLAASKTGSAPN